MQNLWISIVYSAGDQKKLVMHEDDLRSCARPTAGSYLGGSLLDSVPSVPPTSCAGLSTPLSYLNIFHKFYAWTLNNAYIRLFVLETMAMNKPTPQPKLCTHAFLGLLLSNPTQHFT